MIKIVYIRRWTVGQRLLVEISEFRRCQERRRSVKGQGAIGHDSCHEDM